jgi:hypothetical protein
MEPTSQLMPSDPPHYCARQADPCRPSAVPREPRNLPGRRVSHRGGSGQLTLITLGSRDWPRVNLTRHVAILQPARSRRPSSSRLDHRASKHYRTPQGLDSGAAHGLRSCSAFLAASASHAGHVPPSSSIARPIASRALAPRRQSVSPPRRATHTHAHSLAGRSEDHCLRAISTSPRGV